MRLSAAVLLGLTGGIVAAVALRDGDRPDPRPAVTTRPQNQPEPDQLGQHIEVAGTLDLTLREQNPSPDAIWVLALSRALTGSAIPDPSTTCPDLYYWARRHGAENSALVRLALDARAIRDTTVKLDRITGRVTGRSDPSGTATLACDPSGRYDEQSVSVEDDTPTGEGIFLADSSADTASESSTIPREYPTQETPLGSGETLTTNFVVYAAGGEEDTRYVLDVVLVVNGHRRQVSLSDRGRPFLLREIPGGMGYSPPGYSWRSTPTPGFSFSPATTPR
jgi:hypothetical protein